MNPRGTLIFILVATVLMVVLHFVLDVGPSLPESVQVSVAPKDAPVFYTHLQYPETLPSSGPVALDQPDVEEVISAYALPTAEEPEHIAPEGPKSTPKKVAKAVAPKKKAPAYSPITVTGSPEIAIIIDDMGVDRKHSQRVIDIDAPITLSFLPYADGLDDITKRARDKGHELMIHMPMQAITNPVSLGPIAIKSGMSEDEVKSNMLAAFESFSGYVGLNNHMGSKVTQDPVLMNWVMESLKGRGLYFIDSKTIGNSVAADVARQNGLPTAERDVFLDHEETPEFVAGALQKLEHIAAKRGYAIAIGHPKEVTINGLLAWLPDAQARGFKIVPASALLERPKKVALADVPHPSGNVSMEARKAPEVIVFKAVEETQPAAGDEASGIVMDDPNSAQAREAILKKLLGQGG